MATATNIQLPYLKDTRLDGNNIYKPREMTERFRNYIKKIHNIDIKQILTDDTVPTDEKGDTKEPEIRQDFIRLAGPSAIKIITIGEFNTDPDTIKIETLIQLFREYYMPNISTDAAISSGQSKKTTRHPKNNGTKY